MILYEGNKHYLDRTLLLYFTVWELLLKIKFGKACRCMFSVFAWKQLRHISGAVCALRLGHTCSAKRKSQCQSWRILQLFGILKKKEIKRKSSLITILNLDLFWCAWMVLHSVFVHLFMSVARCDIKTAPRETSVAGTLLCARSFLPSNIK